MQTNSRKTPSLLRAGVGLKICGMKYEENIEAIAKLQPDYLGFIFYPKSKRNFQGTIPKISENIKKVGVFVDADIDFVVEKVKKHRFSAIQLHGEESPEYCKKLRNRFRETTGRPQRFSKPLGSDKDLPGRKEESVVAKVEESSPKPDHSAQDKSVEVPVLSRIEVSCTEPVEVSRTEPVEVWKVFSIKDSFDFKELTSYEGIADRFLFDTKGKEKGGNGYTFDWNVLKDYPSQTPFILSGGIGLDEIESLKTFLKQPESQSLYAIDINSKFEDEPGLKNFKKVEEFLNEVRKIMSEKLIRDSFNIIEESNEYSILKDFENNLKIKLGSKYFINEEKYPRINFKFNNEDLNYFFELEKQEKELKSFIDNPDDLTPREKLMLSMLWKNGDLGKEKYILDGLFNKERSDNKNSGYVFYQFGKKLKSPSKEPIIDQHILRAFKFYQNVVHQNNYSYSDTTSTKENQKAIQEYKIWIEKKIIAKNDSEDFLYYTDRILFGIGKYLKRELKNKKNEIPGK